MHCNNLKYGDIVYITKSFCSMKVKFCFCLFGFFFWGGGGGSMWAYFWPPFHKIRIWAVMKSSGYNTTRNGFYEP